MATSGDELQALVLDIVESAPPPEEDSILSSSPQDSQGIVSSEEERVAPDVIEDNKGQAEKEQKAAVVPNADAAESLSADDDEDETPIMTGKTVESTVPSSSSTPSPSIEEAIKRARQQPKLAKEEAELAAKYAAIESLSERAFQILLDLGMVQVTSEGQ